MADFHILESKNSTNDKIAEFEDECFRLFPYEILFYLKLRDLHGLPPIISSHPLMQQPLAIFPAEGKEIGVVNIVLDQVLEKFRKEESYA